MRARRWALIAFLAAGVWMASGLALAQNESEHGQASHPSAAESGESHTINWYYGLIGEKEGVEPSIWWRPKGMSPPLFAEIFDAALLIYLVVRMARRPVADALKKRKAAILEGMENAAKMKRDAASRLEDYEDKLQHIDEEIERVKREMRAAGEAERVRILDEARQRRARMEREAHLLIEQELKAAREVLLRETVQNAVRSAEELLKKQIGPADHQQLSEEYLASLDRVALGAPGGKA